MTTARGRKKAPVIRSPAARVLQQPVPPAPPSAPVPAANGKKKKKKKGKGKAVEGTAPVHYDDEEYEDDGDPALEPLDEATYEQPLTRSASRTGLSPELESVHLTTTASLSASAAAAARLSPMADTDVDLAATAEHLARSVNRSAGPGEGGKGDDPWKLFPDQLRNFVWHTYSQLSSPGNEVQKTQAMYAIAQQIHAGAGVHVNAGAGKHGTRYGPDACPTFDPALFTDPAFTRAMEQATAGIHPTAEGDGLPPPNVVLVNEYGTEEHEYAEDEYFSEDEADDLEDDITDGRRAQAAQFTLSYEETIVHAQNYAEMNGYANGYDTPPGRKKNKKKKKKTTGSGTPPRPARPMSPAPDAAGPGAEIRRSPPDSAADVTNLAPTVSVSNRMPAVATAAAAAARPPPAANPPPSSRAAGKQPMSYSAPAPAPAANPPPASRRAASKAPVTSHAYPHNHAHHHPSPPSSNASAPHKPRPPANGTGQSHAAKNNKIWSTSTTEERERIKEFWLGLGEEERRNLVKIEKEAVLKKMKEQQKHSCSCAVCGRKRNAIEEELEVLYDAYYEELEQYANYQQRYISSGGTLPPPQGPGPFPGSVELDKNGAVINPHVPVNAAPRAKNVVMTNGRKPVKPPESEFDEDDAEDEDYEDEEDYEEEEEEEEEEDEEDEGEGEDEEDVKPHTDRRAPNRRRAAPNGAKANGREGIAGFGNNLTVTGTGNILTVADDLLKNDGQKFLEMMEQLAERRMQREEEAAADVEDESEEEDDEDGDEDDDEEDEEDEDEDEEETMTEEQKMEEGKRMFSIFAARMFEQRVLQAYREKVAQERQLQLLRELEDEDKINKEKEAKKQTQNQKKKDKKRQQKLAKDAAKAAEKAAEEEASKAKQAALEEEQRKKREEERVRREAQRKVQDEERQRREEERRRRLAEEKEREAERERKRKEREEKNKAERREKEERERKAREEREAKLTAERAAAAAAKREQQEKEERERKLAKEREEKEKAEKEKAEKEKAEKEARERALQQLQQQRASAARNTRPPTSPRNATSAGPSQRSPSHAAPAKKILIKPVPPPAVAPVIQPPRPQQPRVSVVTSPQLPTPATPQLPNHLPPPSTPIYSPGSGVIPPPTLSPRVSYTPSGSFVGMIPSTSMQQVPSLGPSALPRTFGNGSPFETPFGRPLGPPAPIAPPTPSGHPAPIAPPSRASQNTLASPTMFAGPSARTPAADPGPITRPIAPIARPSTGEASGSGSTSPSRRSPSPKGVLGSSALIPDDDEVVGAPVGRRSVAPGTVGQGWGPATASPRSSVPDMRSPWGPPAPTFASPRPPPIGPSLWSTPNPDWHSSSFFGSPYTTHNPSPPPHSGS